MKIRILTILTLFVTLLLLDWYIIGKQVKIIKFKEDISKSKDTITTIKVINIKKTKTIIPFKYNSKKLNDTLIDKSK